MSEYIHIEKSHHKTENEVNSKIRAKKRYAGFWMRFWAFLIDLIVIGSLNMILLSPFKLSDEPYVLIGTLTLYGLLSSIVFYFYFLFMTKYFSQTIGKMILGVRVVRKDGERLQWGDLLFREIVGRFIHTVFGILNLLYIVIGFTMEKEGIHDMLARTRVVHVK